MTALLLDGFDHYGQGAAGAANMLDGAWAEVQNSQLTTAGPGTPSWGARTGTYALAGQGYQGSYRRVLPAAIGRVFLSLGFSVDGLPIASLRNQVCSFRDSGNNVIANLWCQSDGSLQLRKGDVNNTLLASTQGPVIVSRNWHFLEMDFNQGAGDFVLRIDDSSGSGTPAISASGLSLGAELVSQITVLDFAVASSGFSEAWLDDLFIRDTNGTVNNGWLGDRRVSTLMANADTPTAGWTPRYYEKIGAGILNDTAANAAVSAASSSSLNVGAGDFTIESFVRFQATPGSTYKAVVFGKWDETNNQRSYQLFLGSQSLNGGSLCFQTSTDGTPSTVQQPIVYPWTPELDRWYHMALVRASGELLLFVDGAQLGLPIADSRTYFAGAAPMGLGGQAETSGSSTVIAANTSVQGWFDETRLTVGYARYTANFTPPTVALPRGSANDPQWADVALLCGYDSQIQDESGFNRALTARNGAVQQTVFDGPAVGAWSTVGKATPDDNTFLEAPYLVASDILTLDAQPAANDTVTVGTKDGTNAAVYTFVSALTAAYQVLIDTSLQQTLQNLYNAINAGPGAGTKYGSSTTANVDVTAVQLPAGQLEVTANTAGSAGNSIAAHTSLTNGGGWATATLEGGADIPGPSDFKVQRPPPLTTIISAVQITQRSFKSDAGLCSVQSALVGPLGTVSSAAAHGLTVSPSYYGDIFEEDPDTSAAITPATLINGRIRLNRTV